MMYVGTLAISDVCHQ